MRARYSAIAGVLALVMLTGCAGVQFVQDNEIFSQLVARRAGYHLAKGNPDAASVAKTAAQPILAAIETGSTATAVKAMIDAGVAELLKKYDDPMLVADLQLIMSGLKFDGMGDGPIDEKVKLAYMSNVVKAFLAGVEIAGRA